MHHSKSLKLINRTTAAVSNINSAKKSEKAKHLGGKNKKKVKRNSTGNMEVHIEQRSMRKNKEKMQKMKEDIFKGIEIEKCQPIAQIEKPTLIDKVADYRPRNVREIDGNIHENEACYYSNPLKSYKSSMKNLSQDNSFLLDRKNEYTVKRKQSMNIFSTNRLAHHKTTESLLDNLDSYISALKKTQSFQTLQDIRPIGKKKQLFQGTHQKAKEKQMYWMLNQEINKAQAILEELIIENYYQAKKIEKNNKRHQQMKRYFLQAHQKIESLKNGIYCQKMQRKNCKKKLSQYAQMFMTQKMKSRQKLINIYHNFRQQPQDNEDQSGQIHIYHPGKFSHKHSQEKIQRNASKKDISNKRIQQRVQKLLNYNYDSDSDISNS